MRALEVAPDPAGGKLENTIIKYEKGDQNELFK